MIEGQEGIPGTEAHVPAFADPALRTEAAYPREACVHELVQAQVQRTPGAVAVVFEGERVTYAELNARANRLAHHLRALGVGPDARAAICVQRGPELVVGMLAVLKAGGAYVPLDPSYPDERLRYMLADSRPVVLLATPALAERFAGSGVPILDPANAAAWANHPPTDPRPAGLSADHLCYVIYTSGSTGLPKGVAVPHRGVLNLIGWHQRAYGVTGADRATQFASPAFDAAAWETWPYLAAGAELHLLPDAVRAAPASVLDYFSRARITLAFLPTPVAEAVLDQTDRGAPPPLALRALLTGGDALHRGPGAAPFRLVNHYGPTESSVVSTAAEVPADCAGAPPIGVPIDNQTGYVLDGWMDPVAVGVAGELYVGGAGLARGYLGRPALTAERFVPDPFGAPGGRLYRTGDRVRWKENAEVRECGSAEVSGGSGDSRTHALTHSRTGVLEFLGRLDFQVKIRGFRIELGEIESVLLSHPGVREAVVLALDDGAGGKRLAAYFTGEGVEGEALRAHLSGRLPEYMVPAAFVRMEALPLTPNGKLDRRALPAPGADAFAARAYEAPSGKAEEALATVWAELLGVERVGRGDHFLALGGHSLLAARVAARVREALGVEVLPGDVFERPVLADFARGLQAATRADPAAIVPVDRSSAIPLSFAQQRLWFLEQLGNLGGTYHVPMGLRLRGALDRGALVRALDRIIARHEALRTTFPTRDGEPVQRIAPAGESGFQLVEHDLHAAPDAEDELRRLARDEAGAPFDLAHGPLFRGRLVRMAADDHVLLLTMHHIVSDGWSMGVLHRELGALYAAFARGEPDPLPPLPVQYADYAAWHRRWVAGEVLQRQADYWRETLAGAPELLELPVDHPRPVKQDFAGASHTVELDEALTAALRTLSQRHGATLYMTLLAGWAAVLARLSGQDEVVVGTPSANRGRGEVEDLIGFFVNTLPIRVDLSGAPTVAEALGRVKARALEAQQNQDIPFEQVVERVQPARSLAHSPLFQVMFAWQNAPGGSLELPGLSLGLADAAPHATAKFDLLLSLSEDEGRIVGEVEYATALFDGATVARWMGYLRRMLEGMAADDGRGMDRLPMLAGSERALVLREWNATEAAYPREACVHELVQAQAERTPGAVAVVFEGERVTYAELNARANRLAHHLRALGVGPDVRVGICVERSVEMVVGLLGILKAGGAYVPLDASYPVDRLRNMVEDSAPAVLLTHPPQAATAAALTAGYAIPVLDLTGGAPWAERPAENPGRDGLGPRNLAHVLFTSGSTGRPKGVMLEHGSLVNRLAWMQDRYGMEPGEALLQKTPFSFDVSFWEFFWPLMVGARLVMARPGGHRDPAYLVEVIRREGITVAHFVPSMLPLFLEHPDAAQCTSLRRVPVSGEAVSAALVRQFHERLPGVGLFNQYGPTESGEVTEWACDPGAERVSIGRAIHNSAVYVLDRAGEPAPLGAAGELFIGGVAVARGYLGRPRLTAERFVPDPFGAPGARMYRTGDLCRWTADGTLEYLGRTDFQVKIRGFRVEPGEVEARLAAHPGVREAAVLAMDDRAGGKRLVAYFVGEALESEALRAHLSRQLPEYMVPAAFVPLDAFPVTPNGKLDRRALPAPDADAFAARAYEAAVGEAENVLAGIWSELLGVERVGRGDHFFALGGHSLLAVRVVSRVRQALGVEASPGDLFERPVLADFARGLQTAAHADLPAIVPAERGASLPLSFAQQRLWFIEQMGGVGAAYHLPMRLRLKGALDREALVRALERIVARHEVLRTAFPETDGVPVQRISAVEECPFRLAEHDLEGRSDAPRELGRLVAEEAGAPFHLARGPLVRGRLIRLAADDHVLLITMHHIVSDGWSMGIFTRELSALYEAFRGGRPDPLPPLPVQYADYTAWQRRWVDGDVLRKQGDYWRETLSGAPALLRLPTDHARPARQDFAGAWLRVELDEALTAALKRLGQRHGATLFMTLLAGWAAVLARLSGQDDVVIGTPSANRGHAEIEGLIGFFVNTLALRVDLSGSPGVAELLGRVRERSLGAQHHQDIPFEQVVERVQPVRSPAHTPLFQTMFAWQNAPEEKLQLPGLALGPLNPLDSEDAPSPEAARFDLSLALWEDGGRIEGVVEYATALFERETVERWLGYLRRVLEGMVADERESVERLELLSAAERRRVVEEWNATEADYPRELCIHELFEAQAARTPGAVAVVYESERVTYAALNARANQLAHGLRALGVGPDTRAAICVHRGVEMMVGLLAIMKAGGAYVPLDPAYPAERLAYMLADSAPAVLLTQGSLAGLFGGTDVRVIDLVADAGTWAGQPETNPGRPGIGLTPDHLAYVIYTSGSTGQPKGVMVEHRSLANLVAWHCAAFGVKAGDRSSSVAGFGFDATTWEVWQSLCAGGTLMLPATRDPQALLEWWEEQTLDVSFLPTPLAEVAFARGRASAGLRTLLIGGDRLRSIPAGPLPFTLVNNYGPTETTVVATSGEVGASAKVHIGRPIANTRVYLLGRTGEPVPEGVAGELYIGGAGVARGYHHRPGLTAERFVPDPFSVDGGARLYRTGDLARWLADGTLEFLGRTDFQVKIRGFRIEPGEIEARLSDHPAVRDAVVLVRQDASGDQRLVAYYVGEALDVEMLRAHLSERLPEYMVPAAYVRLETLPLTPNGKVDRKALPAPEGDAFPARGYEAPSNEAEEAVAAIWAELLGAEPVGRRDHFFELGGHSLLAVRLASRVRQALGVEAASGDVFERPVLADFARGLQTAARAKAAVIERVDRTGSAPLSFAQQRLWFLEQLGGMGAAYHVPMRLRLHGELDRGALVRSLDRIVARHEVLRTTFAAVDGEPVQHVAPVGESGLRIVDHDLHAAPDAEDELRRLVRDEAGAPFDLERGPLIRGRLVRMAADDHVLLLTMHHIVSDGWSMGVLHRELGALYAAFARGEPDPLPPLPVQYADYAAWHRRWVEGEVLRRQADYWRETLSGAPELLELPADHPRPAKQDFAGASLQIELDEALTAALRTLSQRHGATLYMTLLAGWAVVLARLSGQDEVVVGTPSANRGRGEVEDLIGFFVNTLPIRVDLSGAPTVAEALGRVKARALEAQQNQDIPFEQVVERVQPVRSLAHSPLFQVMFAWQNAPDGTLELPGLAVGPVGAAESDTSKFDLTLTLSEEDGRVVGEVEYATALFDGATVARWIGYLRRVLEGMAQDDAVRVDGIPLLPPAERARLVEEWSAGGAAPAAEQCIHHLFEAQAARTPHATALVHEGERLTYAQLDARANRLAHLLALRGVEREAAVGVCLEWRPELVVALLATLKAGGVYVPLDPSLPPGRLAYIAQDAGVRAVITRAGLADRVPSGAAVRVDVDADEVSTAPGEAPRALVFPEDLAYVIYTSGSTGEPKGVAVEHGAVAAHLLAAARVHGMVPEDRVLQFASAGFDVSLEQVFLPLLTGATLVLRGAELWSATEFRARVRALGITFANLPPAYWLEVADGAAEDALAGIRLLLIGGDALPASAADGRGAGRLVNGYGPTETVVTATVFDAVEGFAGAVVPIGRPLPGRAVYVLDPRGAPVPVGVAGELHIGGGLLARGYLGRPALTAERFVPDPFGGVPGGRMYRTGDRVRWKESAGVRECGSAEVRGGSGGTRTDALTHGCTGVLEFLGRTDFQVKIRGFRIELGEIEAALRSHDAVRDAVVLARADAPGGTRLVAYVAGDETAGADVLRAHLSERLPEYMLPAAYVRLETIPLTPNGKVDRKALPAPEGDAFATGGYEAPSGRVEEAVAAIWAKLLGAERVGRGDHFFKLGGHSLLAVRVVSRVRQALGVEALPRDVFERPVLADFARGLQTAARAEAAATERVDRSGTIPLSFAQQRLWVLEQLGSLGSTYHIPMGLRLRGGLDRNALVRALDRVVARHEVLRTSFPTVDGEPVQRIAPVEESGFRLVEHDLRASPDAEDELRRIMAGEASAPFDLAHGPLFRGRLARMAADDHVLLLTMHHIVSDGWSMGVLFRELGALYTAFSRGEADPLPPLPVQYADYAVWHRRWVEGPVLEAQAEYWTRTLAGAPELLELPTDHPRPSKQDFAGGWVDVELDEALAAALKTLSQRHGATLFMTLLAGWAAVLARLSGQDDVVIGTPSANRGRAEVEEMIGFFVNTLPVRIDLSEGPRVGELLDRVKARALEAQRNQDIPFEQVVERVRPVRSLAYSPLFSVMFAWEDEADGGLALPGLTVADAGAAGMDTAKFDLLLSLGERDGRVTGGLTYARSLFQHETVERYAGYFRRVLEAMAADEGGRMDRVALLAAAEHDRVVHGWNRTAADVPRGVCLPDLFEAQAARTPDADAVVFGDQSLSFAALNARANRLAHHLRALGVGPDARVGLCLERGVDAIVGLLAALKAGGAYVPLDPSYPVVRLREMLADSAPVVLLTQASLRERVGSPGVPILALDADAGAWAERPAQNPARPGLTPEHLAYVIYTSGSTGRPKGVMVRHGSVVNLAGALQARIYAEHPSPLRVGVNAPLVFDGSVKQVVQLLAGHALCLVPEAVRRDPAALVAWLRRERVDGLDMTPSLLRLALAEGLGRDGGFPRFVLVGGEAVDDELRERMSHVPTRFYNVYGPTECTVDVTAREIQAAGPAAAIGGPLPNVAAYVLDPGLLPVPAGVAGELYVGGAGVARGYLNRPGTTAERFVPDPFGGAAGARLYRTGDRVRWREESAEVRECVSADVDPAVSHSRTPALTHSRTAFLEYLGRLDVQVKVRGFRIELGEIEAALRSHDAVRDAVVVAREDAPGETRLVAYVVGDAPDAQALRAHLSERLPEYMVPAAYVRLQAFPVTTNGKVDRKALPAPEGDAFAARGYEAPDGETEEAVAAIWADLLRVKRVGRNDHFFQLGGNSLLATRLVFRIRREMDVELSASDVFEKPELAALAQHVLDVQLAQFDPDQIEELLALARAADGG